MPKIKPEKVMSKMSPTDDFFSHAFKIISKEVLVEIGRGIIEGLTEEEACILNGIKPSQLKEAKKADENVDIFLRKKMIEWKRSQLQTINKKPSEKTSQWLLEKLMPEQFANKNKNTAPRNALGEMLKDIQSREDSTNITPVQDQSVFEEESEINLEDVLS